MIRQACNYGHNRTKIAFLAFLMFLTRLTLGYQTSIDHSLVTVTPATPYSDVPTTVRVKTYDSAGVPLTTEDNVTIYIEVTKQCTLADPQGSCVEVANADAVSGLPLTLTATYVSNGEYEASFTIVSSQGTLTVGAFMRTKGLYGEYFTDMDFSVLGATTQDETLSINWGLGAISPLAEADFVSARWTGVLYSPTTGTYYFQFKADDWISMEIGNAYAEGNFLGTTELQVNLQAGAYNPFTVQFKEYTGFAYIQVSWKKPGDSAYQTITSEPQTTFRVDGIHDVQIAPSSIPATSEITHAPTTHVASATTVYTMKMQSKNMNGEVHAVDDDTYTVQFFDSASTLITQASSVTSLGNSLYQADTYLTLAGQLTTTTTMANGFTFETVGAQTELKNSPTTVLVTPGEIDPLQCYTDVPTLTINDQTAGAPYSFTISFVDKWGNLHYQPEQGGFASSITVEVRADFVDDTDWRSVILPYDEGWIDTANGSPVIDLTQDLSNGKMNAAVTIFHAGIYSLSITIDGVDVINSPHLEKLIVQPSTINALNCVPAEVPTQIHAGFDYSFLIQGRDSFDNNIFQTLADAVGFETTSASLTFTKNSQISVTATFDDATIVEQAGVYQVDFSLPKSLKSGYYDPIVQLGNDPVADKVPIDSLYVLPCSNFVALDRGLVEGPGDDNVYEKLEYTLGAGPVKIPLEPLVPIENFYCEHTPVHVLQKVILYRSSDSGPEEQPLSSVDDFGISLRLKSKAPSIQVFSTNNFLDGYVVELLFDATVEEEQTWLTAQTVTIGFTWDWESDFEIPVAGNETEEELPKFDKDTVGSSTLNLEFNEETKEQFFSPILLNCNDLDEWSQSLPAIEGEDSNNKVQVTVDLGKISSFLAYQPSSRSFELKRSGLDKLQSMTQSISIKLKNKQNKESFYQIKVFYTCQTGNEQTVQTTYVSDYRFDADPVKPYIHSISQSGEVVVRFDRPMKQPSPPEESIKDKRLLYDSKALSFFEDGVIVGNPVNQNKNFTSIDKSQILINETVYPSVSVALKPFDRETLCIDMLDFYWETTGFTAEEWTIQLNFVSPACVSESTNIGDQLVIIILNQMLFTGTDGKAVEPETILRSQIPRQMSTSEQQAVQLAATASKAIFAGSFFNVLVNVLFKASLSQLVNAIKNVQIIVHILLIQTYMVAHAEAFLNELRQIVAFEVVDLGDYFDEFLKLGGGQSVDVHFEAIGYQSSSSIINLGPIFLVIVILPIYAILLLLLRYCACCQRKFFRRKFGDLFFNDIILFVDGALLIIAVCCTINFYQVQKGFADRNSSYYFALGFILSSLPYILILAGYLCKKFKRINRSGVKSRVGSAYEGLGTRSAGRWIIVFIILSYARRIALSVIITYGIDSTESQRIFMNFGSLIMMGFIAFVRPFENPWSNRLEMGNEFTILLLYSHCITQTEFVTILEGRAVAGWSMILLICLNMVVNFSSIMVKTIKLVIQRVKFCLFKRQKAAELERKHNAEIQALKVPKVVDLNKTAEIPVISKAAEIPVVSKEAEIPVVPKDGEKSNSNIGGKILLKFHKKKVSYTSKERKIPLKVLKAPQLVSSATPISTLMNQRPDDDKDEDQEVEMVHKPGEGYLLDPHQHLRQDIKEWLANNGNGC